MELPLQPRPCFAESRTGVSGSIDFNWGENIPKEVVGGKTFTARWLGKVKVAETKTIFFGLKSDGASRLFIDDRLLIENTGTYETKVDSSERHHLKTKGFAEGRSPVGPQRYYLQHLDKHYRLLSTFSPLSGDWNSK